MPRLAVFVHEVCDHAQCRLRQIQTQAAAVQASQVAKNVTTNELANWTRYRYLRGADGTFHNPFDRGLRQNCIDCWFPDTAPLPPAVLDDDSSSMSLLKMEQGQHLHDLGDCVS